MENSEEKFLEVNQSWQSHLFNFGLAEPQKGKKGLRKPQLGALYASLGHLLSDPTTPATVVMPTGTGKTDTMLGLIVAAKMYRTLILVPSDALRTQIFNKCLDFKKLREIGAVSDVALNPVVMAIGSRMSVDEIASMSGANIIVATPNAINLFDDKALSALGEICSHLIVDEAHHVAAVTWNRVKSLFKNKPCIQFTATPFREDTQALDGRIIYNYPLRDAQIDGYFKKIEFHPVREYNLDLSDAAISDKAVELLRTDLGQGYNHLMLVRARTQTRAESIFELYKKHLDLSPVLIHSQVSDKEKILEGIIQKKHKIIVCVDMLGEGFDLPELKIAAIHDQHISPAVTLQFIGRLTRVDDSLGDAKFVANIANQKTDYQMAALYKESADWSAVIRDVSHEKINAEVLREEFAKQFSDDDAVDILGLNPNPKISAVAYRLKADCWRPEKARDFLSNRETLNYISINDDSSVLIMVTREENQVGWANTEEIHDVTWNLYLAYYRSVDETLFIHTSTDDFQTNHFVKLIAKDAKKIDGEPTFRTLHNIKLIKLQNVGLSRPRKDLRFTMHVGRDINSVLSEIENGTARKSNIFATGFELGRKATAGCSHKGKMWEMNSSSISYWVNWCDRISIKINDQSIKPEDVVKDVMRTEKIEKSWPMGLFYADWPYSIAIETEHKIGFQFQGETLSLLDIQLGKPSYIDARTLSIPVYTSGDDGDTQRLITKLSIILLSDGFKVSCPGAKLIWKDEKTLEDYLEENPLILLSVDGSFVEGNYRYFSTNSLDVKLPKSLIESWDWGSTKIHRESMRSQADLDTVQGYTYKKIENDYQIIFNDDGKGEIADLVAIKEVDGAIHVHLYHCKYCSQKDGVATPRAQVDDVYEVCGQASRSVKWLHTGKVFFDRLLDRYQKFLPKRFNRILKGTPQQLEILRNKCHDHELIFRFFIVQPAISAKKISNDQLAVLGTSYSYIKNVTGSDVKVIVSP